MLMADKVKRYSGKQIKRGCFLGKCERPLHCMQCGFWEMEAERRKVIPLTLCGDGKMRKLLRRKKDGDPEDGADEA